MEKIEKIKDTKVTMVKDLMQKDVYSVYVDSTVFEASVLMASKNIGTLPVVKRDSKSVDTLIGIINDRDIVTKCVAIGKDPKKTKVCECMTPNPVRIVPSATCNDAVRLMSELHVRRLPVVEKEKLVGIISLADIASISASCPNKQFPNPDCILIDFAKELGKTASNSKCCS